MDKKIEEQMRKQEEEGEKLRRAYEAGRLEGRVRVLENLILANTDIKLRSKINFQGGAI